MGFLFLLSTIFILILCFQKSLVRFRVSRLKKKIKNNPLIGIKQQDNSYYYKDRGYAISYRIKDSPAGIKTVEWFSLKRRLRFFEEKILNIKRSLNKFFLYQRWFNLFRPLVVIVLITSLIIFYLGIKEHSLKRIERFKWIASRITGINLESIEYEGEGRFKILGQRESLDREAEPVAIRFNPLSWLFSSDTANIILWSEKSHRYINYPVTISDKGDVWLGKESGQIHGKMLGDNISWDEPQGPRRISGHDIIIEDGKLKIIDE